VKLSDTIKYERRGFGVNLLSVSKVIIKARNLEYFDEFIQEDGHVLKGPC